MTDTTAFDRSLVTIICDLDFPAVIYCPITGKPIVSGFSVDDRETLIEITPQDLEKIPTVQFSFCDELGDFDYKSPAFEQKYEEVRSSVPDADDLTEFEILTEYVKDFGEIPLIFNQVVGRGTFSSSSFIGLDLAVALPHDE